MRGAVLSILCVTCLLAPQAAAEDKPEAIELGPYLRFTAPSQAVVRWHTATPMPTQLEYTAGGKTRNLQDATPKTEHAATLEGLPQNAVERYRVAAESGGELLWSPNYDCETTFNYALPAPPSGPPPFAQDTPAAQAARVAAEHIATQAHVAERGYALIAGSGEGYLAYALAAKTNLHIVGVDTDPEAVDRARAMLRKAGLYGGRLSLYHVEDYNALPFPGSFANLIVSERTLTEGRWDFQAPEAYRLLRPHGGKVLLTQPAGAEPATAQAWAEAFPGDAALRDGWVVAERAPLEGAGTWTHQYGSPDNSARSGEHLAGATRTDQLEVRWIGRPGPRAMVDRNPRKPAPLYANGRLFTQGLHRCIAQDAYNGAILWSLEIPEIERFNMPRDCSNWCTDGQSVYMAIRDACWRVDAATGALTQVYRVKRPGFFWGYVAQVDGLLYGTTVRENVPYTNFRGKNSSGWYDSPLGPVTNKAVADRLFARDKHSGETRWSYEGVIIHSTITIAEGAVYFVESRNPKILAKGSHRAGSGVFQDTHMVALDAQSGEKRWERPLETEAGVVVYYLMHAEDTLFIALSKTDYHLYAYDDTDGAPRWHVNHPWTGSDHSGHMQHPTVLGGTVYLEPRGYDIATGKQLTEKVGRHNGCATYLATESALIYRGAARLLSMWDPATEETTGWTRLRPGCWLSTIAGGGMVLSPEGGGGCSCGNWMETSLAFMKSSD